MDRALHSLQNCSIYWPPTTSKQPSSSSAKTSRNIPKSLPEQHAKDTKSRATVGRTLTSPRCHRKVFAANCRGPMMQLRVPSGRVPHCCAHPTDQLPNAKNDGSTTNSDITSFFGTLIRLTGNDLALQ